MGRSDFCLEFVLGFKPNLSRDTLLDRTGNTKLISALVRGLPRVQSHSTLSYQLWPLNCGLHFEAENLLSFTLALILSRGCQLWKLSAMPAWPVLEYTWWVCYRLGEACLDSRDVTRSSLSLHLGDNRLQCGEYVAFAGGKVWQLCCLPLVITGAIMSSTCIQCLAGKYQTGLGKLFDTFQSLPNYSNIRLKIYKSWLLLIPWSLS